MNKISKKIKGGGLVYSTDRETMEGLFEGLNLSSSSAPELGATKETFTDKVRVWIDKKRKGGKEVTVIQGIIRDETGLKELAGILKTKCGVGGSAKDDDILIQGNQRDKVIALLSEMGFKDIKKAGG